MENNSNVLDPAAMYGIPPCAAAGNEPTIRRENSMPMPAQPQLSFPPTSAANVPEDIDFTRIPSNSNLPSLEEIASYNNLTAQERQRQRQQLQRSGSQQLPYLLDNRSMSPLTQNPIPPVSPSTPTTMPAPGEIRGPVPGGSLEGTGSPDLTDVPPASMALPMPGLRTAMNPSSQPTSIPAESLQYMNGFLRTQIGRIVMVQFLVGTNTLVDKMGILLAVGANYILINETETDDILACDFYNIKFVKFYY